MKVLLIIFGIIGYLLFGFITYFVGIGTEVLGCRKRREYMPWRDRPAYDKLSGTDFDGDTVLGMKRGVRRIGQPFTVQLPMPLKVLQFIFWPISLWYCVIVTLIRIAEFLLEVLKEKQSEKEEREIEEALRETEEETDEKSL